MDKNAIKKYAVWARRELIERVSQRAMIYGITTKDAGDPNAESINGHLLSQIEKRQRQALIRNIKTKGYEQVMEEVAYTWFNRFAALRFMEVNGYLPSHIRMFTNDAGEFKPQILAEAIHLELDGLDMNKVYELESANKSEELYKYLLIVQCNALNSILPGMFQQIEDYTELLFPDYLLREGSVIEQMVTSIPEEDWTDQVQIIGWLYQYYNTEPKDKVFDNLKKNFKISKESIPAATQLFTPDWIVHYMVENSLGRLWLEGHPNDDLKSEWKYYLDETDQESKVQDQLVNIRKEFAELKPEEIRVIDPCMGSGHILCVFFDVLIRIYENYGYTAREAAVKIVEKNIWGLDIDDRAGQLAYFTVMMKARQYDRRFLTRGIQPHVYSIQETNEYKNDYFLLRSNNLLPESHQETLDYLINTFVDAKEYGSILLLENRDYFGLKKAWKLMKIQASENQNVTFWAHVIESKLEQLIDQAIILSQQYHIVVTNPPYMAISNCSGKLVDYIKMNYSNSRYDLFGVFIDKCSQFVLQTGFRGMITQQSWLTLGSYEELRNRLLNSCSLSTLIQIGYNTFPELNSKVAQGVSFVTRGKIPWYKGTYLDLSTSYSASYDKEKAFLEGKSLSQEYCIAQELFSNLPEKEIVFSFTENIYKDYQNEKKINDYGLTRLGMTTADNARFTRLWYEICFDKLITDAPDGITVLKQKKKWVPYNKGGQSVKWYGNMECILNWENDGFEIRNIRDDKGRIRSTVPNTDYYFKPCLTWSKISWNIAFRYRPNGSIFDVAGASLFPNCDMFCLMGFLNSNTVEYLLSRLSPTLNFEGSHIAALPVKSIMFNNKRIRELVLENIGICKEFYDSTELSWDFIRHPLISCSKERSINNEIKQQYKLWQEQSENRFKTLKNNEEELNRIFIDIYNLGDVLLPEVSNDGLSVYKADVRREIRSLISFAVGCMFGRYSLDVPKLVYAGGTWDASKYTTFQPDKDAIIPVCDDEYFEDDIVERFVKFVEVVFGKGTLEENLRFIADAIGGKGSSREIIRNYFINDFYKDHLKVYQKRPIYWLFDSGKKNGFKCLIYIHRYQPDTIARIRTDYVHEQQSRYRTAIANLEQRINGASTSERVKLYKQLTTLQAQAEEIRVYEEKIHHLADQMIKIDLDDGVKHNYEIFKDVLAKIK